MLGVPIRTSSNAVAELFNQLLFLHYVTFNQVRYFKRILNSYNPLIKLSIFELKNGILYGSIRKRLREVYNCEFKDNDLDVLKARIFWVQNHEPRTGCDIVFS